jgi:hypothetical protein
MVSAKPLKEAAFALVRTGPNTSIYLAKQALATYGLDMYLWPWPQGQWPWAHGRARPKFGGCKGWKAAVASGHSFQEPYGLAESQALSKRGGVPEFSAACLAVRTRDQGSAEGDGGQVYPAILLVLADKGEFGDPNATGSGIGVPPFMADLEGVLCVLFGGHLYDGEMGHVRPLFSCEKRVRVQAVVELTHAVRGMSDAYEHRRSHRHKSFHIAKSDLKGFDRTANFCQFFEGGALSAVQVAGRKNGEMGREVGQLGMQFPAEVFDKFSYGIPHVSHQGIAGVLHDGKALLYAAE